MHNEPVCILQYFDEIIKMVINCFKDEDLGPESIPNSMPPAKTVLLCLFTANECLVKRSDSSTKRYYI